MKAFLLAILDTLTAALGVSAVLCLVALIAGACAKRPHLTRENLPETLPDCSALYHWKGFPLVRSGPFGDRAVVCLQKADGTFAWFETSFKEVK